MPHRLIHLVNLLGGTIHIAFVTVLGSVILIKDPSTRRPSQVHLWFDNNSYCKVYLLRITNEAPETRWRGAEMGLLITPVAGRKGFFTLIGAYFPTIKSCLAGNLNSLENSRKSFEPLRDDDLPLYKGIHRINEAGTRMYMITLI